MVSWLITATIKGFTMRIHWLIIYCFLLIRILFSPPVFAFQIFTNPVSGITGEKICVPVQLTNITDALNIDALGFIAEYNEQHLSYSHISKTDTVTTDFLINGAELTPGAVKIVGSKFSNPVCITEDSILVNICFSIDSDLESESITLTEFKDDIAKANVDLTDQPGHTSIKPDNEDSGIGECFIQLIAVDFSDFFGHQNNCVKRSSHKLSGKK
jgi:hypothetical protein